MFGNVPEVAEEVVAGDAPEVQPAEDQEKEIREMLSNPAVKHHAFINAQDMKKRCKGWFTVEAMARKLMLKPEAIQDILSLLCLFEYAYRQEKRGKIIYRIQFSKEDKLKILQERLADAEALVANLKTQIAKLG